GSLCSAVLHGRSRICCGPDATRTVEKGCEIGLKISWCVFPWHGTDFKPVAGMDPRDIPTDKRWHPRYFVIHSVCGGSNARFKNYISRSKLPLLNKVAGQIPSSSTMHNVLCNRLHQEKKIYKFNAVYLEISSRMLGELLNTFKPHNPTTASKMALRATLAKPAVRPQVARASVKPVAALKPAHAKLALAGVASLAMLASTNSAEASQVIATVASAAEGYPFVPPAWAPSLFVPLTGLVLPAIAMATLFVYIEKEAPSS
ncbi:hypothetical protein Vafri_1116, partial [Volvox africanus]